MRLLIAAAAVGALLSACSAGFWDLDPADRIDLPPGAAAGFSVGAVEVRSSFYNPPDAFSRAFEPAFREGMAACFRGDRPVQAVVFIHELDRLDGLDDADGRIRLPGQVDLVDARGRVIGRYRVSVDIPGVAGDLQARRAAASLAFGEALCRTIAAPAP